MPLKSLSSEDEAPVKVILMLSGIEVLNFGKSYPDKYFKLVLLLSKFISITSLDPPLPPELIKVSLALSVFQSVDIKSSFTYLYSLLIKFL